MHELVDGVAVVGTGLAGLTLAGALSARKFPVEVVGFKMGAPRVDRGVCLWGRALTALSRIGLGAAVTERGARVDRLCLWSSRGHLLLDLSERAFPGSVGSVAIRTSHLMAVLEGACAGVPIHAGRRLIGYGEDDNGVTLTLDNGWPIRAPIVVGADGVSSAVRRQCLDDGPPLYSGDSVWEGIGPGARWLTPGTLHLYWDRYGLRGGAVAMDRDGAAAAWWVDQQTGVGGAREFGSRKHELLELLSEMHAPLPELIDATPEEAIRHSDVMARRRARVTGKGRVTLIGDAAHPVPVTLRLGGSLAIEDAVELADALVAEPNPQQALRGYESARAPRVAWASQTIWRLRAVEARTSPTAAWARDAVVGHLPGSRVRRLLSRLLGASDLGEASRASQRATSEGRLRWQRRLWKARHG